MTTDINIKEIDNGFIVTGPHPNLEGECVSVYEYPEYAEDDSKEQLETEVRMLYDVKNLLGLFGSKHDKYRVVITIEDNQQQEKEDN